MKSSEYIMPVLFVKDISISKKFYLDLFSLEIENDFGANVVFKDSFSIWQKKRADEIIFNSEREANSDNTKSLELYFESKNIEEFWKKINLKPIDIIHGLKEEPWGQRTIRFFDPDQFVIEVAEPLDDVILRLSKTGLSDKEISIKTQMPLEDIKKILKKGK